MNKLGLVPGVVGTRYILKNKSSSLSSTGPPGQELNSAQNKRRSDVKFWTDVLYIISCCLNMKWCVVPWNVSGFIIASTTGRSTAHLTPQLLDKLRVLLLHLLCKLLTTITNHKVSPTEYNREILVRKYNGKLWNRAARFWITWELWFYFLNRNHFSE